MVECERSPPRVRLGTDFYVINEKVPFPPNMLEISDEILQNQLDKKSCHISNITFPDSPLISFAIPYNLTFFKCNKTNQHTPPAEDPNFNHMDCDRDVYYLYPDYPSVTPGNLPPNCSVIQLPAATPSIERRYPSDLFSLLTANFSLIYEGSVDCRLCHLERGRCTTKGRSEFHCAKEGSHHQKLILAAAASAAGIGILIILVFLFTKKSALCNSMVFCTTKAENYQNVEMFLKDYGSLAPRRYSYSEVKKMTNSFKVQLGQGGYGCVYRGKIDNGNLVAVKVLNELKGHGEEFANEVASISRTSHVNIVSLLGFCFENRRRALIYEFMPNGSLEKFIYDGCSSTDRQLGWGILYKIAVGIARGLEYLHRGCNTRILHFDIKPHNILLDENFCPKISDFGLAKLCPSRESIVSSMCARGTIGYIAPEVFCRNFGGISNKSDVYSYGMMILEMVGGRKNIDVGVDRTSEIYFSHWIYKQLDGDEELKLHNIMDEEENQIVKKMVIAGLWCIQTDPSSRPSMTRVVEMLEGSPESLKIPPKPFLSSPPRNPADSSTVEIM